MGRSLAFDVLARDRASKTFDKIGKSADQTGRKFGHLGARSKGVSAGIRTGFGAAAGAMAAIGAGQLLKGFIDEAREAGKVTRITENAIRATGGAANVSAKHVGSLAESISNKTAIDDEVIQTSANLLLTFKNVRNEAGKGAKVFDRATTAAVDLSAAGFGSVDGAAKMLGKALNDPIKGISALGRAGVTFTEQQKKQIKTLVESGKTLEAQKIIMKEVESQVGGAGKAAADPMKRLQVVIGNVQEKIGAKLLPIVEKVATWMGDHLPGAIDKATKFFEEKLIPAFTAIWEVVGPLLKTAWEHVIKPVFSALGHAIGKIPETLQFLKEAWTTAWSGIGTLLANVGVAILKSIRVVTNGVLGMVGGILEAGNIIGIFSDDTVSDFNKFRDGVDKSFGGAIDSLNTWKRDLKKAPKIVKLEGKIDKLDKAIADAKDGIKSVPKEKQSEFKGKIADLVAKRKAAQREIDKLKGKTVKVGLAGLPDINSTFNLLKGLGGSEAGGLIPGPSSDRDNHLRMMATGEYVVRARRVNHSTLPILEMINQEGRVPEGYAKGGVVANYKGALAMPQIASYARLLRGAVPDLLSGLKSAVGSLSDKLLGGIGGGGVPSSVSGNAAIVKSIFANQFGWGGHWPSTYRLLMKESGFRNTAQNPTSTAYGLFQFLNSTWRGTGIGKTSNPRLQTIAGGRYIDGRYGNPSNALRFHLAHNWYDQGGYLPTGLSLAYNGTGKPERVVGPQESVMPAEQPIRLHPDDLRAMGEHIAKASSGGDHVTYQVDVKIVQPLASKTDIQTLFKRTLADLERQGVLPHQKYARQGNLLRRGGGA